MRILIKWSCKIFKKTIINLYKINSFTRTSWQDKARKISSTRTVSLNFSIRRCQPKLKKIDNLQRRSHIWITHKMKWIRLLKGTSSQMWEVNILGQEEGEGKTLGRYQLLSNLQLHRLLFSRMDRTHLDLTLYIGRLLEIILRFQSPKERGKVLWVIEKLFQML